MLALYIKLVQRGMVDHSHSMPITIGRTYDSLERNQSSTTNGVTRSYQYDARGNLSSDGVLSYDYDARNQLSSVTGPGLSQQNQYDALGNRIRQTNNGVSTDYL